MHVAAPDIKPVLQPVIGSTSYVAVPSLSKLQSSKVKEISPQTSIASGIPSLSLSKSKKFGRPSPSVSGQIDKKNTPEFKAFVSVTKWVCVTVMPVISSVARISNWANGAAPPIPAVALPVTVTEFPEIVIIASVDDTTVHVAVGEAPSMVHVKESLWLIFELPNVLLAAIIGTAGILKPIVVEYASPSVYPLLSSIRIPVPACPDTLKLTGLPAVATGASIVIV